jgi:hypothetical protein
MSADVHSEAADFLSGLLRQRQADRVVIARQQAPKYLVGFNSSGLAVWTHDVRLAKKFDVGSVELSEAVSALKGLEDVEIVVAKKARAAGANRYRVIYVPPVALGGRDEQGADISG